MPEKQIAQHKFHASFWELGAVYAAGAYSIAIGVALYGEIEHALPVMIVGSALTLYFAARSVECFAAAIATWWRQ